MTAADPPHGVAGSPDRAVDLDGLRRKCGTRRDEATSGYPAGPGILVEADQPAERPRGKGHARDSSVGEAASASSSFSNTRSKVAGNASAFHLSAGGEILTRNAPLGSGRPVRSETRASAARARRRSRLRLTADPTSRPIPKPMRGGSPPRSRRYLTEIPPARTVRPSARRRSNVVRSRIRQIRPRVAFGPSPCATAPRRGRLYSTCGAGNHGVWPACVCSVGKYASSLVLLREHRWSRPIVLLAYSNWTRYLPPGPEV